MALPTTLTIANPGAETGDATGWTVHTEGGIQAVASGEAGVTSHTGSYHFDGGSNDIVASYQDLDPVADGVTTGELDSGNTKLVLTWWQTNSASLDEGTCLLRFLDGAGDTIEGDAPAPLEDYPADDPWTQRTLEARIPPGTRTIRLFVLGKLGDGSIINACWDDLSAEVQTNDLSIETRKRAAIVFRETTASPPTWVNEALGDTPAIADLVDPDGAATGWSLALQSGNLNANDSGGSRYNALVPFGAWADGYAATTQASDFTLRIGGLDDGATYTIRVFSTRWKAGGREMELTVDGDTRSFDAEYNPFEVRDFETVSPTSENIDILVAADGPVEYGYINALVVIQEGEPPAPPPAAARRTVIIGMAM